MDDTTDLKQNARLSQQFYPTANALATPLLQPNHESIQPNEPSTATTTTNTGNNNRIRRGVRQPNKCQDWVFALIFMIHFLSILFIVFTYGVPAINKINNASATDEDDAHYRHYLDYIQLSIFCCGFSFIITCIFKMVLTRLAMRLSSSSPTSSSTPSSTDNDQSIIIKFALGFSTIMSILLSITFYIFLNETWLALICAMFFLFSVCYGFVIKSQMPFASTNLSIAIRAVRSNGGLTIVAHAILCLGIFYIAYWTIAMIGLYAESKENCESASSEDVICNDAAPHNAHVILLFFNFYWAQQVIKNIIHVAVAGTIRTWWFNPNHESTSSVFCCCSKAVSDSLFGAMTYSFGSICLGSLLVTILHILRQFIDYLQEDLNNVILCCTCDCLLAHFENTYQKFNKWGYVYTGMYGYPFTTSSERALSLLESRGWFIIINDDLITNVIGLITLIVGLTNGAVALLLLDFHSEWFSDGDSWRYIIFTTGFMIGIVVSSIMLGIIESSVNTIVLLFAEAPFDFDLNHRQLSQQMRNTWREAYPGIC